MHSRDFYDPAERILVGTAYTLRAGEVELDLGLVGQGIEDLGVDLGVTGGITKRLQVGANIAHAGFGLLNGNVKLNLLDHPAVGLSLRAAVLYASPRTVWILPDSVATLIGDIAFLMVPIRMDLSLPSTRWMSMHLGIGYRHVGIGGRFSNDSILAAGAVTTRQFFFEPTIHFYLGRRVALMGRAHLPAWAATRVNAGVEVEIRPGLTAGATTTEWARARLSKVDNYVLAVEMRLGAKTHLLTGAIIGRLGGALFRPDLLPFLDLSWRLGGRRRHNR